MQLSGDLTGTCIFPKGHTVCINQPRLQWNMYTHTKSSQTHQTATSYAGLQSSWLCCRLSPQRVGRGWASWGRGPAGALKGQVQPSAKWTACFRHSPLDQRFVTARGKKPENESLKWLFGLKVNTLSWLCRSAFTATSILHQTVWCVYDGRKYEGIFHFNSFKTQAALFRLKSFLCFSGNLSYDSRNMGV